MISKKTELMIYKKTELRQALTALGLNDIRANAGHIDLRIEAANTSVLGATLQLAATGTRKRLKAPKKRSTRLSAEGAPTALALKSPRGTTRSESRCTPARLVCARATIQLQKRAKEGKSINNKNRRFIASGVWRNNGKTRVQDTETTWTRVSD